MTGSLPTDAYRVTLSDRVVARLLHRGDYAWLIWQDGYWDDPERPVLGLRFEDNPRERVASALRLPPWFSNLLPEGRLRDWVARDAGISSAREMLLLARLGRDLPGAVGIERIDGSIDPRWRPDDVVPIRAVPHREADSTRFSLAGVALKFSMLQVGERLTLPAHDRGGDWIVKMPDAGYAAVPQNEFAMMSLAARVGLDVPDIKLVHRDELPTLPTGAWPPQQDWAYAIRRFDRTPAGRVHIEDLAQVRGFYPDQKYDGSFATVAALVYRRHDVSSYLEFVRRLFFSFAIGNGDMHLKNVSLIYRDPRRPVISPAYDLVCTAPYRDDEEDLGLKLGRSRRFADVTPTSFRVLASVVRAPREETMHAVSDMAARLPQAWSETRALLGALPTHTRYLDARVADVADRFR